MNILNFGFYIASSAAKFIGYQKSDKYNSRGFLVALQSSSLKHLCHALCERQGIS